MKPHRDGPAIVLVVALGDNGALGKDGGLPWRSQSSDMKHFRKVTLDKPIIMGRRTFESLGRVLDRRTNIILTRDKTFTAPDGAIVVHSFDAALDTAKETASRDGADEIAVIGGETLFEEAMPLASRIYLTEVHASPAADTWFSFDRSQWREVSREHHDAGPKDDHPFSFVLLERA